MSIKLENGLINVGGILTETYTRDTRATPEAKEALGLESNGAYKASIGISRIDEWVLLEAANTTKDNSAIFDLSTFNQEFQLVSLVSGRPNKDRFIVRIGENVGSPAIEFTVNKNLLNKKIPLIPIKANWQMSINAVEDLSYILLTLKPCKILSSVIGAVDD